MSASADLVQYLSSKGVQTYKAAGQEVTAHCWFCPDGDRKGKGKLYLNTESWLYSCKRCDARGNRKTLLEHYGDDDDLTYLPGTDPAMRRKVLNEAAELATDMLWSNPKVLEYLTGRGLTERTIVEAKIGYIPASWGLAGSLRQTNDFRDIKYAGLATPEGQEFFSGHITIPYLVHDSVVQLRGRAYVPGKTVTGAKYITPAGDSARLYNASALNGAKYAIVVEGEFDTLRLQQELQRSTDPIIRNMAVVGVAGSQTLPEGFARYFQECRTVYVGFDADVAGQQGAERVKVALGGKARVLTLPAALPVCDWSDYLNPETETNIHGGHTWQDVADLIAEADAKGRTLFSARDAIYEYRRVQDQVGGMFTGIAGLDSYLNSGMTPGQLLIPIARTGVGKTALCATLAYNMRSRPTLVWTLEMTAAEYMGRLMRIARFYQPWATEAQIAEEFSSLRIVDQRFAPGDLKRHVEDFAEDVGVAPQVIQVDYLGYAAKRMPGGSSYEKVSSAVVEFKEDAKDLSALMIVPHQAGRGARAGSVPSAEDARDSGVVEDTADVMIGLYRPSDADPGLPFDGKTNLNILKNRIGRTGVVVPLLFSMASQVFVEKSSAHARWADYENRLVQSGRTPIEVLAMRQKSAKSPTVQEHLWPVPTQPQGQEARA